MWRIMKKKAILICLITLLIVSATMCFVACDIFDDPKNTDSFPYYINIQGSLDQTATQVAEKTISSIVKTTSTSRLSTKYGSGFFINEFGYVVTNAHCLPNVSFAMPSTKILLTDGSEMPMNVVAYDISKDLAVLKPQNPDFRTENYLTLEQNTTDPNNPTIVNGMRTYIFGYPENVGLLFSKALVSSTSMDVASNGISRIILDTTINHGGSGAPLINEKGNVIGVVYARIENTNASNTNDTVGIGCAVTLTDVTAFLDAAFCKYYIAQT